MSEEMVDIPIVGRIEDDGRIVYDKKPNNPQITEWYQNLVEECKSIITERVTNSKIELLTGYAEVGERIFNDPNYQKYGQGNQDFVDNLFKDIGIGKSTGYKCLQFYEKFIRPYNELDEGIANLPEGKNISWSKIVSKYLPEPNGKTIEEDCQCEKLMCVHCHKTYTREEVINGKKKDGEAN